MKRAFWAVFILGILAVSCGGGNIKKVQNGVFSDYDNTITVGKAIENNKILKGGKWKAVEMDGRKYVTYTASLTGTQVQELLLGLFNTSPEYKDKPNYGTATEFYDNLRKLIGVAGNAEILAKFTTMSGEEFNQARDIFKTKLDAYNQEPDIFKNYTQEEYENVWAEYRERRKNDIEPMLTIDGYEIVLSFVMNQDDTFAINMMESYTEVTLNCFNNLKVRFNAGNSENAQNILSYIYRGFTPKFF